MNLESPTWYKETDPKEQKLKFLQMLKKGSKLYSILTGTCPKCHEESMYCEKNPYKLSSIYKMHDTCSHCETKYMIEPSFFYGAMYVSYGVTVAIGVAIFVNFAPDNSEIMKQSRRFKSLPEDVQKVMKLKMVPNDVNLY